MLERKDVSKSCDVYSYGILLWAIITHKEPFTDVSYVFLPSKVLQGEVSYLIANYLMLFVHITVNLSQILTTVGWRNPLCSTVSPFHLLPMTESEGQIL